MTDKTPLQKHVTIHGSDIPRRVCVDKMHPLELEFYNLKQKIEDMPADPLLTSCGELLSDASDCLSDYLEYERKGE